jgi:O-antigen ligase
VNPHLHNVPLQIAAERGLPALAMWLWFVVSLSSHWSPVPPRIRQGPGGGGTRGGGGDARRGLFEYNFGDSEFLMLFLVLATLPFAAVRVGRARHATGAARG